MTKGLDWKSFVVAQRHPQTGCIPTGYEFLLRASQIEDINYETFQDEFDFDKDLQDGEKSKNNFEHIAEAINHKYPHILFKVMSFPKGSGLDKLKLIEEFIQKEKYILVSLNMTPFSERAGWHIMPAVELDGENLILLYQYSENGIKLLPLNKSEFIRIHEELPGGNDLAYLIERE